MQTAEISPTKPSEEEVTTEKKLLEMIDIKLLIALAIVVIIIVAVTALRKR